MQMKEPPLVTKLLAAMKHFGSESLCSSLVEHMPGYLVPPGSTSSDSHYVLSSGRAYTRLT